MAIAVAAGLLADAPAVHAQGGGVCLGDLTAQGVPERPGERLRFGINPAGEAGAIGPTVPAVPDSPERTLAALERLRPPAAPFVLRLNRFFWSDGEDAFRRFLEATERYSARGFGVELQVRYHPTPSQEGDIGAWVEHVREVVRRFGSNPRVVALQVTNEVNFIPFSPDSSDSAYRGARDALVQGVIAAKDEARRLGYSQLEIGFNWVYRNEPSTERAFWEHLRDSGGQRFVDAVDWVGLDAYPGTVFPPVELAGGGYRDGMVSAISQLRECFMPIAGLGERVPIKVEENGWPTSSQRSYEEQVVALEEMVRAVHDFRGTYNISDYRWFDLRDHLSASENFQHQYGLLRDDYTEKPAFERYRQLVDELALRSPPAAKPRLGLRLGYRPGPRTGRGTRRCVQSRLRATLKGGDVARVRRVEFSVAGRRAVVDGKRPFSRALRLRVLPKGRAHRVSARALLADGRRRTLRRRFVRCGERG